MSGNSTELGQPKSTSPRHGGPAPAERDIVAITRALVSVSDKTGLIELASALAGAGVEIVSTGSTAAGIRAAGFPVTDVASVTGFPESLDGRVKTLHPAVHAGILADLRLPSHRQQLVELGITPIDLVVVNLYPFVETVASGADDDAVIEKIDIGGPAMVRSSAKNFANVAVVVSPEAYPELIAAVRAGGTSLSQRHALAAAAFAHTAEYDAAVAGWFAGSGSEPGAAAGFAGSGSEPGAAAAAEGAPASDGAGALGSAVLAATLRYGENSHQQARLFAEPNGHGIAQAEQLHGKAMSYNNYVDADAALRAAFDFAEPAVAVVKHANPCGIAVDDDIAQAHRKAHACDPVSAYGGVIAANRTVTLAMAETVKDIFTEVVVAPGFEPAAQDLLSTKKNLRLLKLPLDYRRDPVEFRQISGGYLQQSPDTFASGAGTGPASATAATLDSWNLVSGPAADAATRADLEFAWKACRSVKSNAILLAHDQASVGVGMGQVNRVDSCHLAVDRAGERARGAVAASDAYFPFADGLQVL
ncbi:MAG: bifunctional phosphoribosylaminoimidazolecarboxamide formyltransferase/IMP cyclohydrolase, partial [Microbacteriaceae bacterium]